MRRETAKQMTHVLLGKAREQEENKLQKNQKNSTSNP